MLMWQMQESSNWVLEPDSDISAETLTDTKADLSKTEEHVDVTAVLAGSALLILYQENVDDSTTIVDISIDFPPGTEGGRRQCNATFGGWQHTSCNCNDR